ncbi:Alpha/Beta hydrolase protein [Trichoderma sp. SZMC 28014]
MSFFSISTAARRKATLIASLSSLLLSCVHGQFIPEIDATYSSTPKPFTLKVNPSFIETTRLKVQLGRIANDMGVPPFTDGVSTEMAQTLQNYWVDEFNWTSVQEQINKNFTMFTTTVNIDDKNYTEPIPLHYVHHRSPRHDAIPLLFLHGFPGSFLEVGRIISSLTHPPNSSVPAFHVVAPSLPGFGFTPAPVHAGLGPIEAAHAYNALMHQLSYPRYVMQAGDLGAFVTTYQAALHPESVISVLSNLWVPALNATDLARFEANETTPGETAYIRNITAYQTGGAGYLFLQSTQPLMAGHALTDSPLGFALYIFQLMQELGTFYHWSLGEIITWAMMYIIQGPYPATRFYKEFRNADQIVGADMFGPALFVNVPVGVTQRPQDAGWGVPLDWARRIGNVTAIYVHDFGGHFAAYQTPDTLLDDCWRFWGNKSASGIGKR